MTTATIEAGPGQVRLTPLHAYSAQAGIGDAVAVLFAYVSPSSSSGHEPARHQGAREQAIGHDLRAR
jgi:hypothetical protein